MVYQRTPYGKMRTSRKFGGRKYILEGVHRTKALAESAVANLRRTGNLARTTKGARGYTVWFAAK